jgi:hypothetical protein
MATHNSENMSPRAQKLLVSSIVHAFRRFTINEPSSGNVAIVFGNVALSLLKTPLPRISKELLLGLAEVTAEERPYPSAKWANFVRDNLDDPDYVASSLIECLERKALLSESLGALAKDRWDEFGLKPGGNPIVAFGCAVAVCDFLSSLPDELAPLEIITPTLRFGMQSEGSILRHRLNDPPRRVVTIHADRDAVRSIANRRPAGVFLGSAVVAINERAELEIVATSGARDFVDEAAAEGIPSTLVVGSYKIWDQTLYAQHREIIQSKVRTEREVCINPDEMQPLGATLMTNRAYDIVPGDLITRIVTEDGVYTSSEFVKQYDDLLHGRRLGQAEAHDRSRLSTSEEPVDQDFDGVPGDPEELRRGSAIVQQAVRFCRRNRQDLIDTYGTGFLALWGEEVIAHGADFQTVRVQVRSLNGRDQRFVYYTPVMDDAIRVR